MSRKVSLCRVVQWMPPAFSKVLNASGKLALMHFAESGLLSGVLKQQQELAEKLKEAQGTRSRQVKDAAQKRLWDCLPRASFIVAGQQLW